MSIAAVFTSAAALRAGDDRAVVRAILDKIGRSETQVEEVTEFSREGDRVIVLNLNRRGLSAGRITEFPEEIFLLTGLKGLLLKGNDLESLPEGIGGMTSLIELNLADNDRLGTLPASIGSLKNLRTLDVRTCGLSGLPPEIGGLKSLETLQLWGNHFTELPPVVLELTALKELYLSNNKLTTLPSGITRMKNLKYIDAQRNSLCNLPSAIDTWLKGLDRRYRDHQWCN